VKAGVQWWTTLWFRRAVTGVVGVSINDRRGVLAGGAASRGISTYALCLLRARATKITSNISPRCYRMQRHGSISGITSKNGYLAKMARSARQPSPSIKPGAISISGLQQRESPQLSIIEQ